MLMFHQRTDLTGNFLTLGLLDVMKEGRGWRGEMATNPL